MSTTAVITTTTIAGGIGSSKNKKTDSGADFRKSGPIEPTATESNVTGESGTKDTKRFAESGKLIAESGTKDTKRFGIGIAGKTAPKISFRVLTNLSLLFKPYGGLSKENEFCIRPGGVNGAIKPFKSSSGRKQFKKVGIRISYTIKQLLSIRHKFSTFPSDIDIIPNVLVEGLGDFESLTAQTVPSPPKITPSKLRKPIKIKSENTSSTVTPITKKTYANSNSTRFEGNDDDASFRQKKTVTPSKIHVSKLKKRDRTQDKEEAQPTPDTVKQEAKQTETRTERETERETERQTERQTETDKGTTAQMPKEKEKEKEKEKGNEKAYIPKRAAAKSAAKSVKALSTFKSKGAWGRGRKILDPMAQFTAKITIRLNKITMDNFNTLSDQLIGIYSNDISNTEQLTRLVTLIFEKTVQEHVYGPLYAKLCVALSAKNKSFDEMVMSGGKMETRKVGFKHVLVKVCQEEFQKGKRPAVETSEMDKTDRENEEFKQKKILLGTMKFIGQLYLKQLIPSKIMIVCLEHLVGGISGKPTEDDIEGACTLIETVGKTLDEDQTVNTPELRKYYQKLESIERNINKYSPRIRILIQNLIDLRKNSWKGLQTANTGGPRALSQKKNTNTVTNTIYDPFDEQIPLNLAQFAMGAADDAVEMITGSNVPISAHVVGKSQRKFRSTNRYSNQSNISPNSDLIADANTNKNNKKSSQQIHQERSGSRKRKHRKLLEIEDEEALNITKSEEEEEEEKEQGQEKEKEKVNERIGGIGRRKQRIALSSGSTRPCVDGKALDEETLSDLCGDYLYNRNNMNIDNFLKKITKYEMKSISPTQFVYKLIQKAVDGGKLERLSDIVPKLLDEYILLAQELDAGFIEFFKGYTMEDNPQLSEATSQLLAPLIVDNELNFDDVLQWILLDTRENQPQDDMLKYYDGDGVRNYISKSQSITHALQLLGRLLKELKEANFEDSQYVPKLIVEYDLGIDRYINKKDAANKDEIQKEWIKKYGLQFAF